MKTAVAEVQEAVVIPSMADAIRADLAAGDAGYRAAGEKFIAQKAALKHGEWLPWLKAEGFKERTAQSYMAYSKSASGCGYADWLEQQAASEKPVELVTVESEQQAALKKSKASGRSAGPVVRHRPQGTHREPGEPLSPKWNTTEWRHFRDFDAARVVIKRGFQALALEMHPDKGGSHEAFVALRETQKYMDRNVDFHEGIS